VLFSDCITKDTPPPFTSSNTTFGYTPRKRGYGSYLIQELKRQAYEMGKVPAARCNVVNAASRASLQKAGMLPCARFLTGVLKSE
jgi:hypothetical protein